jgi:excisionase family DNA binding protein
VSFGIYWSSLWREVPDVDDEILTIRELAALLKIGEKTAYTMAQSAELPGFMVRDLWRFRRADIGAWIAGKVQRKDPGLEEE